MNDVRRRGRIVTALAVAELVVVTIIVIQVVQYGTHDLKLASVLILLTIVTVGVSAWYLSGRAYPAEEAFRLGYQAGWRDGRRQGSPKVVPMRRAG